MLPTKDPVARSPPPTPVAASNRPGPIAASVSPDGFFFGVLRSLSSRQTDLETRADVDVLRLELHTGSLGLYFQQNGEIAIRMSCIDRALHHVTSRLRYR